MIPIFKNNMELEEAAQHCEKAWANYANKHNIKRDEDTFFILKMQEELGELTRHYLESKNSEFSKKSPEELRRKLEGDCASLIGNALILAHHFKVNIEKTLLEKFPVS